MSGPGHRRAQGRKLLLLVASLGLTLLALEGLVRLLGLERASYHSISSFCRYDPDLGWNLIPNHRAVFHGRHFAAVVETSEQGLRDRLYSLVPEMGRRRVLVIGDSFAWCWGVEIEQCFTKRLESMLHGTDVITMGVPGYSTAQAMRLYELEGHRFNPDVVVLVFVGNDRGENMERSGRPHFELRDGSLVQTNVPVERGSGPLKEWLTRNSRLYVQAKFGTQVVHELLKVVVERMVPDEVAAPGSSGGVQEDSPQDVSWRLTEALLDRLKSRVETDGAELVIAVADTDAKTTDLLTQFCAARECRLTDAKPALQSAEAAGKQVRLVGDPHLAAAGQVILAESLLPLLRIP